MYTYNAKNPLDIPDLKSLLAPEGNICFKNSVIQEALQKPDEDNFFVDVV